MAGTKTNQKRKLGSKNDSFLEAFRELGASFGSSSQKFPQESDGMSDSFSQRESELEQSYRSQIQRSEQLRREEKILFTRQERETKQQVQALQSEIKKLATATAGLAQQAEITAMQEVPTPGNYHISFLEKLLKAVTELRKQVQESSMWLESWNKKSQKRNSYWGQFKKSGSKFLLSADRYMATQAG